MSADPFPDLGPDAPEPAGSGPQPARGSGNGGAPRSDENWSEEDWDCAAYTGELVAAAAAGEDLTAEDISQAGFAQDGAADQMYPGPALAALVHAATTDEKLLATLSEDDLIGLLRGTRRLESLAAWAQMTVIHEFAARHPAVPEPAGRTRVGEFSADELAPAMRVTWQSAAGQISYACSVAERLPRTFAALRAGKIHPVHVRIIEDETSILSAKDAAVADEKLAEAAQSKTFGELRYAAHRLVLSLDPEAVRRRKEAASQDAHIRRFREGSGNAGMTARELPPDEVLASWQHVDQRARDLHVAGIPGTLQYLRTRAYLDLLQGRDTRTTPPEPPRDPDTPDPGTPDPGSPDPGSPDHGNADPAPGNPDCGPSDGPGGTGQPVPDSGPSLAAQVTLTIPLGTQQGTSDIPGDVGGFGLVDPQTARDLVAAAGRHPDTRWCYTALHPDGTAAAHACAPGRHDGPPDPRTLKFTTVIRGPCDHAHAQDRYRPSRTLRHLIAARNTRCTAPGCGQAAACCDLDHTDPWHQGGSTCQCNLAPLCRHHHRCKQAQGWWLDQPAPGILKWRTPAGRSYTTTPTEYPL